MSTMVRGRLRPSLNWLLVFVPVSFLSAEVLHNPPLTFLTAALAIIPLAGLIGRGTEELAVRAGPRVGGLLNATFGNITEMIISILLIANGQLLVVKASLIGSILGNIVLVLGASLFAGGLRFKEQQFSARSASVHGVSLFMAVIALIMPTLFTLGGNDTPFQRIVVSGGVAVVLIVLYVANLLFTLVTHQHLFRTAASEGGPTWPAWQAITVLLVSAVVVGVMSELLVGALEPTVAALGISELFIGLFVVAIIGNAAEHATAVVFALRNQTDISIEIAFGSASQIAMFVAPALVFVSLLLGHPMDFIFTPIEVAAVTLATIIVVLITLDGKANWLEGLQLLGVYVIFALSFFFLPE